MSKGDCFVSFAPKETCMLVEIDRHGAPHSFGLLPPEETAKLWTLAGGFPLFRAHAPIFDAQTRAQFDKADWAASDVIRKLVTLRDLLRYGAADPDNEDYFLSTQNAKTLSILHPDGPAALASLTQLVARFPKGGEKGTFAAKLFQLFSEKLDRVSTMEEMDFLKDLLCGTGSRLVCFELYDRRDFANPVCSGETRDALEAALQ